MQRTDSQIGSIGRASRPEMHAMRKHIHFDRRRPGWVGGLLSGSIRAVQYSCPAASSSLPVLCYRSCNGLFNLLCAVRRGVLPSGRTSVLLPEFHPVIQAVWIVRPFLAMPERAHRACARARRLDQNPVIAHGNHLLLEMERQTGIEPASPAWEAGILPLNQCRINDAEFSPLMVRRFRRTALSSGLSASLSVVSRCLSVRYPSGSRRGATPHFPALHRG